MSFSEWENVKLGEVCESVSKKHSFNKSELIFLNTSDILAGQVLHNNYSKIDEMPGQAKKVFRVEIYYIVKLDQLIRDILM